MTVSDRAPHVLADVVSLVDAVLDDFDLVELLADLTRRGIDVLEVDSVGVLLADPTGALHVMTTESTRPSDVRLWEIQRDDGPCRECHDTGAVVSVADLRLGRDRWRTFADSALEDGFRAAHAVPMRAAGRVLGSLGLLGRDPGGLDASGVTAARVLAQVATVAVVQAASPTGPDVNALLQRALAARTVVEQARGLVAHHFDVTVDAGLELMRAYANAAGRHLTDVAQDLMHEPGRRAPIFAAMATSG